MKKILFCLMTLGIFLFSVPVLADETACVPKTFNGHAYRIFVGSKTWDAAEQYCESLGGHLVTITSEEEMNFIETLPLDEGFRYNYWIGARYQYISKSKSYSWTWKTGEEWEYTNWIPEYSNPSESKTDAEGYIYGYIGKDSSNSTEEYYWQWDEKNNNNTRAYICEWDTVPDSLSFEHSWVERSTEEYRYLRNINSEEHGYETVCVCCGDKKIINNAKHTWDYSDITYNYKDSTYHTCTVSCLCGATKTYSEKHTLDKTFCDYIRYASPAKKGIVRYFCPYCLKEFKRTYFSWKYKSLLDDKTSGCLSYDIEYSSTVYKNSKSIKVALNRSLKGAILNIKIGKKTYKKKLTNNSKNITVKIKKPSAFSKIKVTLYYHGKLIGKNADGDDIVLYAKKIKKGMTKKQIKATYDFRYKWSSIDSTSSGSNGISYWFFKDGSIMRFKHGKLTGWLKKN